MNEIPELFFTKTSLSYLNRTLMPACSLNSKATKETYKNEIYKHYDLQVIVPINQIKNEYI